MRVKRQFFTRKFASAKLNALGYTVDSTFAECQEMGEVVRLGSSQALRSIQDIRKRTVHRGHLDRLYAERRQLYRQAEKLGRRRPTFAREVEKQRQRSDSIQERLMAIERRITNTLYIPEYITVTIDHPAHYKHIFEHGVVINGQSFHRFSCSASQARASTVVLVADDIASELSRRINNGRDMQKKLAPSKFNAYYGLSTSATEVVTTPRFIVVKDYENVSRFAAHFLHEEDWAVDDTFETRELDTPMNRTDGMGLITPAMSQRWAEDLGLDWIPAQWVVRQSFIKGLLCTFPIQQFCEEVNGGEYLVDTIYTDTHGEPIKADLRDVDVILSESQFKLWDSYRDIPSYVRHCAENHLQWGVTQFSPKQPKDILKMNYQFIQTLDLDRHGVEALCSQFIDWIEGVSLSKRGYMLLFLLGVNHTEDSLRRAIRAGDNWWMKAIASNEEAIKDPYIRRKIRELVIGRIQAGCVGEIIVDGNFEFMVSDPYAYMQHVCGQKPTGLLGAGEIYSGYWSQRGVTEVNTARSPQTYRCENLVMQVVDDEQTRKWYAWSPQGIIINWHGHEVVNWGGADFDGDILATTNNRTVIDAVYRDELTVTYEAPKPAKKLFNDHDLYEADLFGFGGIIGSITNKSTAAYALLPAAADRYGKNSPEVQLLESRLRQCCVAQSKQIDM